MLATWLLLAAITLLLARPNLSIPGLYYDEAIFAGMAKDHHTVMVFPLPHLIVAAAASLFWEKSAAAARKFIAIAALIVVASELAAVVSTQNVIGGSGLWSENINSFARAAQDAGENVEIRPYFDRQNRVAFYSIRFKQP